MQQTHANVIIDYRVSFASGRDHNKIECTFHQQTETHPVKDPTDGQIQFANLPAGEDRINLHNRLSELRHSAAEYRNEKKKAPRPLVGAVRSLAISTGWDGNT